MEIIVDRSSSRAPFAQVRDQIMEAVQTGRLPVGTRLPPVRTLAGRLGLAPGTVARAYRELELQGWVDTRGRHGTFVAGPDEDGPARRRLLARQAAAYAEAAADCGIPPDEARELVDQALRDLMPPD